MGERSYWSVAVPVALLCHAAFGVVIWQVNAPVRPFVDCVSVSYDGSYTAHFGYLNNEDEVIELAVGDDNRLLPGEISRGQPVRFVPGRTEAFPNMAFSVKFDGMGVIWEVEGNQAVATPLSKRCKLRDKDHLIKLNERLKQEVLDKAEERKPEPKVEPKAEEKKEPAPKPKKKRKRRGQPKRKKKARKKAEPKENKPAEPAPLTLTNINLTGGVNVQKGEDDIFGDPTIEANERNTRLDDDDGTEDGDPDGKGDGPRKPPKRVMPKPTSAAWKVRGEYPPDAPRMGRLVTVKLSLKVGADGKVKRVKVVKGAGEPFDTEARRVGFKIPFSAGTVGGKKAAMWVPWEVVFDPDA